MPNKPSDSLVRQGILILLPALLLAGLGFYSLRKERLLAEHNARRQAETMATNLSQMLDHEFQSGLEQWVESSKRSSASELSARSDAAWQFWRKELRALVWAWDEAGHPVYPPPARGLGELEVADFSGMSDDQQTLWSHLEEAASKTNYSAGLPAYESLSLLELPASILGPVHYRFGRLALETSHAAEAQAAFLRALECGDSSETGLPGIALACLGLSQVPGGASFWLEQLGAEAVLRPSLFTPFFLEEAERIAPGSMRNWSYLLRLHQKTRALADHCRKIMPPSSEAQWIEWEGSWHFVQSAPGEGIRAFYACHEHDLLSFVRLNLPQEPDYFGTSVEVGGRPALKTDGALLAESRTGPVSVSVHLIDPAGLLAQTRLRMFSMAGLIGAAALAMGFGFMTWRRSFLRLRELNELQTNFVSSVSHEMRAPLASVRLMAEEMNDQNDLDPQKCRKYHGYIIQECQRMANLVENVLDFSRHEQGRMRYEFEPTDLAALVQATCEVMKNRAEEQQIKIDRVLKGTAVAAEVDGQAIQQVLVNLLDNALKHSPPSSVISVGLEFGKETVQIWVEDQGPGIPLEEQEKIFERFYRRGSELRRETQGIGLGLAIVKLAAEAHRGRVQVRSAPGSGSRFTVELPLNRETEA